MTQPFLQSGAVAVVTGAASGIGRAVCGRLAGRGLKLVMVDADGPRLEAAAEGIGGGRDLLVHPADISDPDAVAALAEAAFERFGQVDFLMNNAAVRVAGGDDESLQNWRGTMDVNFWGPVLAERAFLPRMIAQNCPAAIVNTGSKQGITNPPGNVIYNATKSALKTYTEQLQHRLRNTEGCKVTAHLLVPGFTTTGDREHRPGAWRPEQVADYMLDALGRGSFYIICPDDEVTPEVDARRMRWAIGDIVEDRPPLSRWHPDWADAFRQT